MTQVALEFALNNMSLHLISVSLCTVLKSINPLLTYLMASAMSCSVWEIKEESKNTTFNSDSRRESKRTRFNCGICLSLITIMVGVFCTVSSLEVRSRTGVILVLLSCLANSVRGLVLEKLTKVGTENLRRDSVSKDRVQNFNGCDHSPSYPGQNDAPGPLILNNSRYGGSATGPTKALASYQATNRIQQRNPANGNRPSKSKKLKPQWIIYLSYPFAIVMLLPCAIVRDGTTLWDSFWGNDIEGGFGSDHNHGHRPFDSISISHDRNHGRGSWGSGSFHRHHGLQTPISQTSGGQPPSSGPDFAGSNVLELT